jgi:hypothetical protein
MYCLQLQGRSEYSWDMGKKEENLPCLDPQGTGKVLLAFTLKMKETVSSDMLVITYITLYCHNPDNHNLYFHLY